MGKSCYFPKLEVTFQPRMSHLGLSEALARRPVDETISEQVESAQAQRGRTYSTRLPEYTPQTLSAAGLQLGRSAAMIPTSTAPRGLPCFSLSFCPLQPALLHRNGNQKTQKRVRVRLTWFLANTKSKPSVQKHSTSNNTLLLKKYY